MAGQQVIIGCRLPSGLTIHHPVDRRISATIAGTNSSRLVPKPAYVTTEVDAELWAIWKGVYPDYKPLKSGTIFEARNETDAQAKAKELRKEKTGFEPMPQDAAGVKKADNK